jgi:hypothetical protein
MVVRIFEHVQWRWALNDSDSPTAAPAVARPAHPKEDGGARRLRRRHGAPPSEKCVRLAQKKQVGPCIPVGTQLQKAEVGPTSFSLGRLLHLRHGAVVVAHVYVDPPDLGVSVQFNALYFLKNARRSAQFSY